MKPSIPKGTRDFSPTEMVRRNFIFDTIKNVYQKFGFQQIETPAMENLSTLEGKYGEEGDKLLFRIINSGDPFQSVKEKHANERISDFGFRISDFAEKGLRYDLTVPFARYVVMHQNEITFPFKRYQMQPVWRADRPQKGRYREFYQCDADVIGSSSLLNEVELIQIIDEVFSILNIQVSIKINNRKVLQGIAEELKMSEKLIDFTIVIDKLEKIGFEKVVEEIKQQGLPDEMEGAFRNLFQGWNAKDSFDERKIQLEEFLKGSEVGLNGLKELKQIFDIYDLLIKSPMSELKFDVSLARGLNYYTGAIIEVKVNDSQSTFTSSICGGGRYDDLTGIFGLPNVSGVGISFGVDRIYDVMEEMKLFDLLKLNRATTKIFFINFGGEEEKLCLHLLKSIRDAGINAEIYPDSKEIKNVKKQMSYANENNIPFVGVVGSEERAKKVIKLKHMSSGREEEISVKDSFDDLIKRIKDINWI